MDKSCRSRKRVIGRITTKKEYIMEDVMETCYLDSVTMCSKGYKCKSCPKEKEHQEFLKGLKKDFNK